MSVDPAEDPRFTAYALGELSGKERAEIEEILERDSVARRFVAETREFAGKLEGALKKEELPDLMPEQVNRIHEAIATHRKVVPFPGRMIRRALAVAAIVVGVLSAAVFTEQALRKQRPLETAASPAASPSGRAMPVSAPAPAEQLPISKVEDEKIRISKKNEITLDLEKQPANSFGVNALTDSGTSSVDHLMVPGLSETSGSSTPRVVSSISTGTGQLTQETVATGSLIGVTGAGTTLANRAAQTSTSNGASGADSSALALSSTIAQVTVDLAAAQAKPNTWAMMAPATVAASAPGTARDSKRRDDAVASDGADRADAFARITDSLSHGRLPDPRSIDPQQMLQHFTFSPPVRELNRDFSLAVATGKVESHPGKILALVVMQAKTDGTSSSYPDTEYAFDYAGRLRSAGKPGPAGSGYFKVTVDPAELATRHKLVRFFEVPLNPAEPRAAAAEERATRAGETRLYTKTIVDKAPGPARKEARRTELADQADVRFAASVVDFGRLLSAGSPRKEYDSLIESLAKEAGGSADKRWQELLTSVQMARNLAKP